MARVCQELFPENDGYFLEDDLKIQIDVLLKNIKKDWDFTIIITGQGEVRVGKSKLAMDVAFYWTYMIKKLYGIEVPFTLEDNFVFDGKKLIEKGNYLGQNYKYSVLIYDEAGADLEGRKAMQSMTQDVLDFYRECGQYNLLNILVIPEFFDLPKGLALSRSVFLLDVYYSADEEGNFVRGYYNFFSRRQKKKLYIYGKKELDYYAAKYDFHGKFSDFWQVNKEEYKKIKQEVLKKRGSRKRDAVQSQRDAAWYLLNVEFGLKQEDIANKTLALTGRFVARTTVTEGIGHFKFENE